NIIMSTVSIEENDIYLLCSDGLTNCLTDEEISGILSTDGAIDQKVDELITAANDNGGKDNISVVLLQCS
ncbi:MAG: protein phosphatase, partial [Gammaproteobacteria bacterium]|nr:protein phosphatase [Gammaproteobacteria bacterium]